MINNVILGIVRFFIERQLIKWGAAVDWNLVKKDLDARIRQVIPGAMFDDAAAYIACTIIEIVADYFKANPVPKADAPEAGKLIDEAFQIAQSNLVRVLANKAMSAK